MSHNKYYQNVSSFTLFVHEIQYGGINFWFDIQMLHEKGWAYVINYKLESSKCKQEPGLVKYETRLSVGPLYCCLWIDMFKEHQGFTTY